MPNGDLSAVNKSEARQSEREDFRSGNVILEMFRKEFMPITRR